MPMTHDKVLHGRKPSWAAAERIERQLDDGKNVVFLTLGDPTVYSTYFYVHKRVLADGYEAEIVPVCPPSARGGQAGPEPGRGSGDDPHHPLQPRRGAGAGPCRV